MDFTEVIEKMDRAELIEFLQTNTDWKMEEMAVVETEPLRNEARITYAILSEVE